MNIFVTTKCPKRSAKTLDNKRVVKMVLETCQMLSTSLTLHGVPGPYRISHKNHPCSIWARETRENYYWLLEHFKHLLNEYTARYYKVHKCQQYLEYFTQHKDVIPSTKLTPFANCTTYKDLPVHTAYRKLLRDKWKNDKLTPKWEKGNV
jgi:hypothetical protein